MGVGFGFWAGIASKPIEVVAPTLQAAQICPFGSFIFGVSHPGYVPTVVSSRPTISQRTSHVPESKDFGDRTALYNPPVAVNISTHVKVDAE